MNIIDDIKRILEEHELLYYTGKEPGGEAEYLEINIGDVHIQIVYAEDNSMLQYCAKMYTRVPEDKMAAAVMLLNEHNRDLVLKFYLDDRGDLCVDWNVDMRYACVNEHIVMRPLGSLAQGCSVVHEPLLRLRYGGQEESAPAEQESVEDALYKNTPANWDLLDAAVKGDMAALQKALIDGADVRFTDMDDMNALTYAMVNNNEECFKYLLGLPQVRLQMLYELLESEEKNNHSDKYKQLINIRINEIVSNDLRELGLQEDNVQSAIMHAVRDGDAQLLKALVSLDIDISGVKDFCGNTPLHLACSLGYTECARVMLEKYDDICEDAEDLFNDNDENALHVACRCKHVECVKLLLENDFNVFTENAKGENVLYAVNDTTEEIYELLAFLASEDEITQVPAEGRASALTDAAWNGRVDKLRAILRKQDLDVNAAPDHGYTALVAAVRNRRADCVELLLQHPLIDVNYTNGFENSFTPIEIAKEKGYDDIVELLRAAAAHE